jgi:hypothetical protein
MMQIVFVVMAVALGSIVTLGGMSYYDSGLGLRIGVARGLQAQMDIMNSALGTYRAANGGHFPPSGVSIEERLSGYLPNGMLPPLPRGSMGFVWRTIPVNGNESLCVERPAGARIDPDVLHAVVSFAKTQAVRMPAGSVLLGNSCGSGISDPEAMTPASLGTGTSAAVTFPQR